MCQCVLAGAKVCFSSWKKASQSWAALERNRSGGCFTAKPSKGWNNTVPIFMHWTIAILTLLFYNICISQELKSISYKGRSRRLGHYQLIYLIHDGFTWYKPDTSFWNSNWLIDHWLVYCWLGPSGGNETDVNHWQDQLKLLAWWIQLSFSLIDWFIGWLIDWLISRLLIEPK